MNTEVLLYVLLSSWLELALTLVFFVGLVLALRRALQGGGALMAVAFALLMGAGAMALGFQYVVYEARWAGASHAAVALRLGQMGLAIGTLKIAGAVALLVAIFATHRRSGRQ